jgi:acetyl esterase/lipase
MLDESTLLLQGLITLSSPFDIGRLQGHLRSRGMNDDLLRGIFSPQLLPSLPPDHRYSFYQVSPYERCLSLQAGAARHMPRTMMLHGSADATVPTIESMNMCKALQKQGIDAECKVYPGATHTSPFLEGPLSGGRDAVLDDVVQFVVRNKSGDTGFVRPASHWPLMPIFPKVFCSLASRVCPF